MTPDPGSADPLEASLFLSSTYDWVLTFLLFTPFLAAPLAIAAVVVWAVRRGDDGVGWLLLSLLVPVVGPVVYLAVRRRPAPAQPGSPRVNQIPTEPGTASQPGTLG
ncbi:hypothetical protein DNL40_07955 [Xylanimonas oleitrophica]|uniref:Cardiolipin synthase N-terminal domain-containing protein n=1 Tax=Xylanimonas oleitrophica TaxID=2607479 RepID=A0A2W5WRA6_9MICO|nr:PLDc N-terminal domain-containing protein [Xylanimonas oleitrophica]PZR53432.1 hypothetical protein DNL40_07955 [Xylanimonas oleitrophica]